MFRLFKESKYKNFCNFFLYLGYNLIFIAYFMDRVVFLSNYLKIIKLFGLLSISLFCFIKRNEYSRKDIIKIATLMFFAILIYYFSTDNAFIVLFFLIFACKNLKIDNVIRCDLYSKCLIILFLYIFSKLNLTNEYIVYRGSILRSSFGFSHPNNFSLALTSIIIDFLYLKRNQLKWFALFLPLTAFFIVYKYTDSRASMILIVIIGLLMLYKIIIKNKNIKLVNKIFDNKIFQFLVKNSWIIMTLISFAVVLLYYLKTKIGISFNNKLSGRLSMWNKFLNNYSIKLFGNSVEFISSEDSAILNQNVMVIDNSYIRLLIQYGSFIFIYFYYLFYKLFNRLFNNKNFLMIVICLIFILYGFVESGIYKITINVFLISFKDIIFGEKTDI